MYTPVPAILALHGNGGTGTVVSKNGVADAPKPPPAHTSPGSSAFSGPHLTPSMWLALGQLLKARDIARQLGLPEWEFAVEIDALEKAGCDHNDLRALICQGLIEHALELTARPAKRRTFRRMPGLRLTPKSCFVLSDWGVAVSTQDSGEPAALPAKGFSTAAPAPSLPPVWDAARRELRLGQLVLKRFRQPAKNQEAILAAFQEDGWPIRIDSPIRNGNDANAPERVHNAVKRLNRQIRRFIRFESDGNGEGVMWALDPAETLANQERTRSEP